MEREGVGGLLFVPGVSASVFMLHSNPLNEETIQKASVPFPFPHSVSSVPRTEQ